MSDTNLVILSGTVSKPPEVRTTSGGLDVGSLSIEVVETWNGGERKEFIRVVGWKDLADTINRITVGDRILVQGRWSSRSWEDKNGSKKRSTEVVARSIDTLSSGSTGRAIAVRDDDDELDDLPF
jgi:single-strand DNA-binding protein